MKRWLQITAVGLLVAFAGSTFLLQAFHHDVVPLPRERGPAFATHLCGEEEHHIPLENVHGCALCAQYSQRLFMLVSGACISHVQSLLGMCVPPDGGETPSVDFPHCDPRAPPVA